MPFTFALIIARHKDTVKPQRTNAPLFPPLLRSRWMRPIVRRRSNLIPTLQAKNVEVAISGMTINDARKKLKENGEYDKIFAKWFGGKK